VVAVRLAVATLMVCAVSWGFSVAGDVFALATAGSLPAGIRGYWIAIFAQILLETAGCIAGLVIGLRLRRRAAPGRAGRFLVVYALALVGGSLLANFVMQFVWGFLFR
jgi:hypothetical protein